MLPAGRAQALRSSRDSTACAAKVSCAVAAEVAQKAIMDPFLTVKHLCCSLDLAQYAARLVPRSPGALEALQQLQRAVTN